MRIRSRYLAALVGVTDMLLWTAVVPFEVYCRTEIAQRHDTGFLLLMLLVNVLLLALIGAAAVALGELMRRGLNRPLRDMARLLRSRVPALVPVRFRGSR